MTSEEKPILTSDDTSEEEKIKLSLSGKYAKYILIIGIIIWIAFIGVLQYYFLQTSFTPIIMKIAPGLFILMGIVIFTVYICKPDGVEITISNKNHTLTLQKTNLCFKKNEPKIINLEEIEKICIINSLGNVQSFGNYMIIYTNGTNEDISNYLNGFTDDSIVNCQNFLKKYLAVKNTIPQMMGIILQWVPGYNPNISPMANAYDPNFVQVQ